jgi:hypothetical protein
MTIEPVIKNSSPSSAPASHRVHGSRPQIRKPNPYLPGLEMPASPAGEDGPLQAEILTLRDLIRQVGEEKDAQHPWEDMLKILDALGKSCTRLCILLKTDRELGGPADFATQVRKSMGSVLAEWRDEKGDD